MYKAKKDFRGFKTGDVVSHLKHGVISKWLKLGFIEELKELPIEKKVIKEDKPIVKETKEKAKPKKSFFGKRK